MSWSGTPCKAYTLQRSGFRRSDTSCHGSRLPALTRMRKGASGISGQGGSRSTCMVGSRRLNLSRIKATVYKLNLTVYSLSLSFGKREAITSPSFPRVRRAPRICRHAGSGSRSNPRSRTGTAVTQAHSRTGRRMGSLFRESWCTKSSAGDGLPGRAACTIPQEAREGRAHKPPSFPRPSARLASFRPPSK